MWSSWQSALVGTAKAAPQQAQAQTQCNSSSSHRHSTSTHLPKLDVKPDASGELESAMSEALQEEIPSLISRPPAAHLADQVDQKAIESPGHSRSPSHSLAIKPLSRTGTPAPSPPPSANSFAADVRRASSDITSSPSSRRNSSSTQQPLQQRQPSASSSRPSLLSQLSSRSLHSPSTFSYSSALVAPSSDRSGGHPSLISRPAHIWNPEFNSPSAARHARRFSSIARAGVDVDHPLDDEEAHRGSINLRGDVEDTPAPASTPTTTSFWNAIASLGRLDPDGVVRPSTETASEDGSSGFLDAMARLRAAVGLPDGADPHAWLKSHQSELNRALDEEDRFSDNKNGTGGEGDFEQNLLRLQDKYGSPNNPVIFCHGLFGFRSLGPQTLPALTLQYWRGVVEVLEANGTEVLVTQVPASASIEDRAKVLSEQIEERFAGRQVNLIGHSMGGLDGRYLISQLADTYTFRVKSLTTIATPHRGSAFADYMLDEVIGRDNLPTLLGVLKTLHIPGGGAAFENLTRSAMKEFNERVTDDPNCKYFSWGAAFRPAFYNEFRVPWRVIQRVEGENDGMVSVESSKWGQYQGTLNNCSHLHLIGWVPYISSAWAEMLGKPVPFRPNSFYLQVCEDLAHEGF